MFGYVRPVLNLLSEEDRRAYQSAYCGLCHTMGKRHGWLARFTLNYDFTLLALLHYGCSKSCEVMDRKCPLHPLQKKRTCLCGEPLEAAADESVILTWHKLSDDIVDCGFWVGLPARVLRRLLRKGYRRAASAQPEFDRSVCCEMQKLRELELKRSSQLDRVADTFAKILSGAAHSCALECNCERAMEQMLYHLGRWIYLVDAWDDLKSDCKSGRYNPLAIRFSGHAEEERDYIETTMTHSVRLIHASANLIDFGVWQPIIENILFHGLPTVQNAVLEGNWKALRKQGRAIHERSI